MRLEPLLSDASCLVIKDARDRDAVLDHIARAAAATLALPDHAEILKGLIARETEVPTSTPEGVAFPHTVIPGLERVALVIASLHPPVRFRPTDATPARVVFGLVGSREKPFEHVRLLARLARVARAPEARERLATASDPATLLARVIAEDRSHG